MNMVKAKRIRHFLRLTYPVRVVADDFVYKGDYPDLPGCAVQSDDLRQLYTELEMQRRQWITERVLDDAPIPLPNSHLDPDAKPSLPEELEEDTVHAG